MSFQNYLFGSLLLWYEHNEGDPYLVAGVDEVFHSSQRRNNRVVCYGNTITVFCVPIVVQGGRRSHC